MSHTPGPWTISGCQLGDKLLIELEANDTPSPCIGSVYADAGRLPQHANARLITTAPDGLALAEHLLAMGDDAYLSGHPEFLALVAEAKAMKAKAEGRTS